MSKIVFLGIYSKIMKNIISSVNCRDKIQKVQSKKWILDILDDQGHTNLFLKSQTNYRGPSMFQFEF